jgi:hypothetical protein
MICVSLWLGRPAGVWFRTAQKKQLCHDAALAE